MTSIMRCFGLSPHSVLDRLNSSELKNPRSLASSMFVGSLSFGIVSVIAYSIWAFRLISGTAPLYTAIAVVYVGLSGVALSRLCIAPRIQLRFSLLFALAFLAYALLWCAFWFGLQGKHNGDLFGSAFGLAVMTALFFRAFDRTGGFLASFSVLFTFHTLGYYVGSELYAATSAPFSRLLWGAAHGLGFGAGLGYLIFQCQEPLRSALQRR